MTKAIRGGITAPKGFKASAVNCGIKKRRKDLALIYSDIPARATALFTTNRIQAAPLIIAREHLRNSRAQSIIINSGNANACTGPRGLDNARLMAKLTAEQLGIKEEDILVASTGIIGKPLPMDYVEKGVRKLVPSLSRQGGREAAQAIMTTDTSVKDMAVKIQLRDKKIRVGGMAKGAGMISPHLATMLVFLTTDALISKEALRKALKVSVDKSFNSITIDGAMSTNDMVVILANGLAKNDEIRDSGEDFSRFQEALDRVTLYLAKMMVADGEGATKFIEVKVKNAKNFLEAKRAASSIANSNLVKTALYGEDPNWGRIMAALGQAAVELNEGKVDIRLGRQLIVKGGKEKKFDSAKVKKIMAEPEIKITVDLNLGKGEATFWTCDLSEDYVRINSRYST